MKKQKITRLSIIVYIYIAGFILYILVGPIPNYKFDQYKNSPQKACYTRIRILQGAIEMYNMDSDTMISTTLNLEELQKGNYIKDINDFKAPYTPEPYCSYSISGDFTDDGQVLCNYHGTVDDTVPVKDNEEPYASMIAKDKYNKLIEDFLPLCIERLPIALIWPIYLTLMLIAKIIFKSY